MTTLQEFRCEVCGLVTTSPTHWFVIRWGDSDLTVYRWNSETASSAGARHYCGEAHAEVYISRWFDSVRHWALIPVTAQFVDGHIHSEYSCIPKKSPVFGVQAIILRKRSSDSQR